MAVRRSCHVSSICIEHIALGCRNAKGSRQSGQLVAPAYRGAILSGFSDDLAPVTLTLFKATLYSNRTTLDLERRGSHDLRNDLGASAIPVTSRWNQRMATPLC